MLKIVKGEENEVDVNTIISIVFFIIGAVTSFGLDFANANKMKRKKEECKENEQLRERYTFNINVYNSLAVIKMLIVTIGLWLLNK